MTTTFSKRNSLPADTHSISTGQSLSERIP